MSDYRYYEFQAVDHPLGDADMEVLRALSTRARITSTSFANHYEWGDLKADPMDLVACWFDLHLHVAIWGTRRLTIRMPKRLVDDDSRFEAFTMGSELAEVFDAGEHLILDICGESEDGDLDGLGDGSGWLGALAPLRADLLSGDWRLAYLLWLEALESGNLRDDGLEPLPGIGPLSGALKAFAEFFRIDRDLVQAAAEAPAGGAHAELSPDAARAAVASIPSAEKTELLCGFAASDPYAAAKLRARVREIAGAASRDGPAQCRTVLELRTRAAAIREERETAETARRESERRHRERQAAAERRTRLEALRLRGDGVWREIESEIGKSNAGSYERATALLLDLQALAEENGDMAGFSDRLDALRLRHRRKRRFIKGLSGLDRPRGA